MKTCLALFGLFLLPLYDSSARSVASGAPLAASADNSDLKEGGNLSTTVGSEQPGSARFEWTALMSHLSQNTRIKILSALLNPKLNKAGFLCKMPLFSGLCDHFLLRNLGLIVFSPDSADTESTVNIQNPQHFGLQGTSFFIECEEGFQVDCVKDFKLGAWQLEPTTPRYKDITILMMHGIMTNRAAGHRINLYKVLTNMGYRVIAFDYRGFGDSSAVEVIGEQSTGEDALLAATWLRQQLGPQEKMVVWGHSMGTAVATIAVSRLADGPGNPVQALILEAPFNNFMEAGLNTARDSLIQEDILHVLNQTWILDNFQFTSDKWIENVKVPVLILHAEDDQMVPITLGRKLNAAAKGSGVTVKMIEFSGSLGYGHSNLSRAPELPSYIRRFFKQLS